MPRFIANYTVLPSGNVLRNHVTELDDQGCLLALHTVDDELPYTSYVPHPILVLPAHYRSKVTKLMPFAGNLDTLLRRLRQLHLATPIIGDPVALYQVDTTTGRMTLLNP